MAGPDSSGGAGGGVDSAGADRGAGGGKPVRGQDFFYRDRPNPETGEAPMRCRDCGYEFSIPDDWANDHSGESVGCPGCALPSRIPTAEEAEWPYRKDPTDPMAGVGMTDRGGTG